MRNATGHTIKSNRGINWSSYVERIHFQWAVPCGWWIDLETGERIQKEWGESMALLHSEVSEAMEGYRKDLMDDKIPTRKMLEVEIADAVIRLCDTAGGYGFHLEDARGDHRFHNHLYGSVKEGIARIHYHISDLTYVCSNNRACVVLSAILVFCDTHKLDLIGAMEEKMEYNKTRGDHKLSSRRAEGGKKF